MKKLLFIFILTFSFQSLIKADDITDFEIEGISLGDSLLEFYNEKKILKSKVDWYDNRKKNQYLAFALNDTNFTKYDFVDVWTFYESKDYIIDGVSGVIYFGKNKQFKDIDHCYDKQIEIADELSKFFSNPDRNGPNKFTHSRDETGESSYTDIYFNFGVDYDITISCYDFSKKNEKENNQQDHFAIFIRSTILGDWLGE